MSRYTGDSRDRVLEAVDMIDLISTRVELRRAGVNSYFGLCPFHDERSGSFHVSPDEKLYHCFGCQASGNPFDFVMETEGLDFKGALESLADRYGVQLATEAEDPQAAARRQRRERLYTLMRRTAEFYSRYLWESREATDARAYLLGRGLTEETLREFRVGYAPSAWDKVLLGSRRAGFDEEELLAAGLVQRSKARPGSVYDRFRSQIMFPAADDRGRVRGFGARRMREDQRVPKYVNTADGELYHKSEVLFGIDLARRHAAKADTVLLAEGYTDVLALHQADVRNAVGIMGTSLTAEQVAILERFAHTLVLCLDADQAGQKAMLRAAELAAGRRLELRVVPLPEGQDPADLALAQGGEALAELVQRSVPFVSFNVDWILSRADTHSAEGRDEALARLAPMVRVLGGGVLHDDLLRRIASRLELSFAQVAGLASELQRPSVAGANGGAAGAGGGPSGPERVAASDPALRQERLFLALCVALPHDGEAALAAVDIDELLTSNANRAAARQLAGRLATPLAELPSDDEPLARTIADIVTQAGRVPSPSPERLAHSRLLLELHRVERAITRARIERTGVSELAGERERLRGELSAVVARLEKTL